PIALLAQPIDVRGERLALGLVVIQHADFASDELSYPNGRGVSLCARSANVPESAQRHQRISRHIANAAVFLRLAEALGEVCALTGAYQVAIPNVLVLLGPLLEVGYALLVQGLGKPWVVAPVQLDDFAFLRRARPKALVGRTVFALRVPCDPDFRAFFSDGV